MTTQTTYQGQIIKVLSGFYYVEEAETHTIYQTRGRGQFRNTDTTPLVGDKVVFQAENAEEGLVTEILPRHNAMIRPPVANVDVAFLVVSVKDPVISPKLIDRYLVYLESLEIIPVIYFSKVDLLTNAEYDEWKERITLYQNIGYTTFLNTELSADKERLTALISGRTMVAVGQSGVGKSTFLNQILPTEKIETAEVSKSLGRGRHTTRHTELHAVFGGKVADTPGFSSIDIDYISKEALDSYFPEMCALKGQCKFRECTHQHEPKCAVKTAVADGTITQQRYDSFIQMYQEIANAKPVYKRKK